MATHSSILAWRIPWTGEPGGPQSMGSQRIRHNWAHTHSCRSEWLPCLFLDKALPITPAQGQVSCCPHSQRDLAFSVLAPTHTPTRSKWLQSIMPSFSPRDILSIITWVGVLLLLSLLCSVTKYPSLPTLIENLSASWVSGWHCWLLWKDLQQCWEKIIIEMVQRSTEDKSFLFCFVLFFFFHLISLKDKLSSLGNCISSACFGKTSGVTVRLFLGNSSSPYPPLLLLLGLGRKSGPLVTTDQNWQGKPIERPIKQHGPEENFINEALKCGLVGEDAMTTCV